MRRFKLKLPRRISRPRMHTRTWVALGILLLILPIAIVALLKPNRSSAAWFNEGWAYRKKITFTHNADLTNRRVTVTVDTATLISEGKMQDDCDDARFTDGNGLLLLYQLTGSCNNASTTYDVVFPTVINGENIGFFYYGNPTAVSQSTDVSSYTSLSPNGGSPSLSSEESGNMPTGWWKMDEGYGSTTYDSTSAGNNASLGGTISDGAEATSNRIRQEINIINNTATSSGDHPALVSLNTANYDGTVSYYFEVVASVSSGTLTVALERAGTTTQDATISVTETSATRKRSTAFTPPAGATQYNINLSGGTSPQVKAARIIVIQEGEGIAETESQFEIGNHETGKNNTSAATLSNPKYWKYTAANWDPAPTFYAEVAYKATIAGGSPTTVTLTSSQSWQAPAGVTSVSIEAWGGGAGGVSDTSGGGGGGGGAYTAGTVSVTPGNSYSVTVGATASGGSNGNNSSFPGDSQTVTANGGSTGSSNTGGSGGTAQSVGGHITAARAGGDGGTGVSSGNPGSRRGGGGGGSATSSANGNPGANGSSGGAGGTGQATGGTGGLGNTNPTNGGVPGAGGGGSGNTSTGGTGGRGEVKLTYTASDSVTIKLQQDDGSFGNWTDVTNGTIVNGGTATSATRVRTSTGFTPVDGRHYRIVASVSSSSSSYEIYNAKIVAQQEGSNLIVLDSYPESNGSVTHVNLSTTDSMGQTFQPSTTATVASVTFMLQRTGSPTGNIVTKVYAGTGTFGTNAVPTGSALATSNAMNVSLISTSFELITFDFPSGQQPTLTAGNTYVVTVESSTLSTSSGNTMAVRGDNTSPTHPGNFALFTSGSWLGANSSDLIFYVHYSDPLVEKLESQYLIANTGSFGGSTGLKDFDTRWDPNEWAVVTNTYYHEGNGAASGTGDIKLQSSPNGTPADVTGSTVTDTVEVERSSALTMPASSTDIDVNVTGTGTLNASKIVAVVQLNDGAGGGSGTTVGAPTWKSRDMCLTNSCLYFTGSETAAIVANTDAVDFDTGFADAFTWSAWIKANSDGEGDAGQIFNKGTNSYLRVGGQSGSTMNLVASLDLGTTDATATASGVITANKWHHVSLSYTDDGDDEITLWVDGKAVATSSDGAGSPATSDGFDFVIGHGLTTGAFHGFIDDVRIYNYERTSSEISHLANIANSTSRGSAVIFGSQDNSFLNDGLVGYWMMEDNVSGGSQTIIDLSGNDKSGTTENGANATGMNCVTSGKFGSGCNLDGSDDYIQISDIGDQMSHLTVSVWLYSESSFENNDSLIYMGQNGSYTNYTRLYSTGGGLKVQSRGVITNTPTVTYLNNWVLYTITLTPSHVSYYVNGELVDTITPPDSFLSYDTFRFGNSSTGAQGIDGTIDETRLYNRALSTAEVKALYNWAPGPVGHWSFDENAGTTSVYDKSGNGGTATMNNLETADWRPGKYGSALDLQGQSGDSEHVSVPTHDRYKHSDEMTLMAWVNSSDWGTGSKVIASYYNHNGSSESGFIFGRFWGANVGLTVFSGSDITDRTMTTNPTVGTWEHVAAVFKKGQYIKLYKNGVEQSTNSPVYNGTFGLDFNFSTPRDIHIGKRSDDDSQWYTGGIDEFKMYNYARTPQQIVEDMNGGHPIGGSPVASMQNHWKFDEGYGTTANDSGFGNYDGTLANSPTWKMNTDCKINGCLEFNGSNQYVAATGNQTATEFSISMWIKPDDVTSRGIAEMKELPGSNTHDRALFFDSNSKLVAYNYDGSEDGAVSTTTFQTGTWYHIAFVKDSSNVSVWVNGKREAITASGNAWSSYTTPEYVIGQTYTSFGAQGSVSDGHYDGLIDEVKFYTTALTEEQIRIDMNANSGIALGTTTTSEKAQNLGGAAGNPPIAYWDFNENTGTTVNDKSGNGNTGTSDTSTWEVGKVGSAVNFNGTSDSIAVANESNFDFERTNSFSITAWVKVDSETHGAIITKMAHVAPFTGWHFDTSFVESTSDVRLSFYLVNDWAGNNRIRAYTDQAIDDGLWHHVAVTYDGSSNRSGITFYVDGIVSPQDTDGTPTVYNNLSSSILNNIPAHIGSRNDSADWMEGSLDDVKVFNYQLTQAQIMYDYNRGAPVGHWKFDECSGTTAYDASGKGNNGTITPGASGNTAAGTCDSGTATHMWNDGTTGKLNASLGLDGTDDYVALSNSTILSPGTGDMTISAWVKLGTSANTEQWIYGDFGATTNNVVILRTINGDFQGFFRDGDGDDIRPSTDDAVFPISTGVWYHVVAVRSGTTGYVYVNGVLRGTETDAALGTISVSDGDAPNIGRRSTSANYFNGQIDDVRIYNYALSENQVRKLMLDNSGVRFGPSEGQPE